MIKSCSVSFTLIGLEKRRIEEIRISGYTRNFGRWSDIEAAKLPKIILGKAILEKI